MHFIYSHLVEQVGIFTNDFFCCCKYRLYHLQIGKEIEQVSSANHLPEGLPINCVSNVQRFQTSDVAIEAFLSVSEHPEKHNVCNVRVPSPILEVSGNVVFFCKDNMF